MKERPYQLDIGKDRLVLRTTSFRAEKGSVLHEGIYNREFVSSLAAAAVGGMVVFLLAVFFGHGAMNYVIGGGVFIVVFPLFRKFLFWEPFLLTGIDRARGEVTVTLRKPLVGGVIRKPLDHLKDIKVHHTREEIPNPDAVEFVERISLQHGTVTPGLGEAKEFYSVNLVFEDDVISVFVSGKNDEALSVAESLRSFVFSA